MPIIAMLPFSRIRLDLLVALGAVCLASGPPSRSLAADAPDSNAFLAFVRDQASALRADDHPPASLNAWRKQREDLRRKLSAAWGGFPAQAAPLRPKVLGTLERDGYRVERIVFQTRPG